MKRSQIIKLLAEQLFYRDKAHNHEFWYNEEDRPLLKDDEHENLYLGDADKLLKTLEELGMLPPVTMRYIDQPSGNTLCSEVCEWDEE